MAYEQEFTDIQAAEILPWIAQHKGEGWQFVQMLATLVEDGVDIVYTLRRDAVVKNGVVRNVAPDQHIPSITGAYLAAFVFENEIHDLFGVAVDGIAIDFGGKFYKVAVDKPMTVLSPEQIAAREKAKKAAAAKAAKAAKAAAEKAAGEGKTEAKSAPPKLSPEEFEAQKKQALREGRLAAWEAEQAQAKEAGDE